MLISSEEEKGGNSNGKDHVLASEWFKSFTTVMFLRIICLKFKKNQQFEQNKKV